MALMLDFYLFAIPLMILGFWFSDISFALGHWGRLIGYGIIFLYWSVFNSGLRKGQTFGKQLMKIAVVDRNGEYLSLSRSMLRAFILVSIGLLNKWGLPILQKPVFAILAIAIVFGGSLALVYGGIFNGTTRQGIHDLIAGSYVVKAPLNKKTSFPATPVIHKVIIFGLVGVGLIWGFAMFMQGFKPVLSFLEEGEWQDIKELQSVISEQYDVFSVSVRRQNVYQVGDSPNGSKYLGVDVWVKKSCDREPKYCDELLNQVARATVKNYDGIDNLTRTRITVFNRFDFGLASGEFNVRRTNITP